MKRLIEYNVINYFDVWGNAHDGFEVNNLCKESFTLKIDTELEGEDFRRAIQQELKKHRFFKSSVRLASWRIDWNCSDDSFIEIEETRNGCPVCRLEKARELTDARYTLTLSDESGNHSCSEI